MLRPNLQPKLKIKLTTHFLTKGKMRILLKYIKKIQDGERILKNEAQKWIQSF